jgi:hypothetical protein
MTEWEPGDPLYNRGGFSSVGYVRRICQIQHDHPPTSECILSDVGNPLCIGTDAARWPEPMAAWDLGEDRVTQNAE